MFCNAEADNYFHFFIIHPESVKLTFLLRAEKENPLLCFNALSHASLVFLLLWVKRWKPLSLSPVDSWASVSKICYFSFEGLKLI